MTDRSILNEIPTERKILLVSILVILTVAVIRFVALLFSVAEVGS